MGALKRFQKVLTKPYVWFLLEEAKRGDREAFGKLYQYYVDALYRYAFFRVGQKKEVAEDVVADTFTKTWEKLDTFKTGSFQAWIYMILKNTLVDYYRKESKIQVGLDEEKADERDQLEEKVLRSLECQEAVAAIKMLTEDQQEVLLLKFVEDMSNKEIADVTGKNEAAIRALQHRGLEQLRKHFTYDKR